MPCHYCGHCMQGCEVGAIFTSANTLLPAAQRTGRLTLRSGALVREIEVDREGRASAVALHRPADRQDRRGPGLGGRRRLRRDRVAAPAAQLEVEPPSQRPRQRQRPGGPLSPRPHDPDDVRLRPAARRPRRDQRRRGDRPRDHRAVQPPAREARLRRRLHGAAPVRRSGLPPSRQARAGVRRGVQASGAGPAAGAHAAGRLRQSRRAARQPRHGGSGHGPTATGSRFRSCTSRTATTTARSGAT